MRCNSILDSAQARAHIAHLQPNSATNRFATITRRRKKIMKKLSTVLPALKTGARGIAVAALLATGITGLHLAATGDAAAQAYPNRPITMIYPFPPAGSPVAFNALFQEASKVLGQPIVVEYKPGAGNRFGVTDIMKARPDGYTLAAATDSVLAVLPLTNSTFKAEAGRDYLPLMQMIEYFFVITAHPSVPFRDFQGLIAHARANPGKLNFAGTEPGGVRHFLLERIQAATGIRMTNVPYKGDAASLTDRLSGIVEIGISAGGFKPHIDSGKLVAIVTTGPKRMQEFPGVPTMEETGYKGFTLTSWFGLIAPAGTPPEIMTRLNAALNEGLKSPEVIRLLAQQGFQPVGGSPEQFAQKIKADMAANAPVVSKLGLKFD
jgi:tripartite-type tricarboxylate transporter receptor subunit TctC